MKTDRQLVKEAIEGWELIRVSRSPVGIKRYKLGNHLAQQPLCDRYKPPSCEGCPVMRATSRPMCHHTPFDLARRHVVDWARGKIKKSQYAIRRQIDFLTHLESLEALRALVSDRLDRGMAPASELRIITGMTPQKLSKWMSQQDYRAIMVRNGDVKTLFYEKPNPASVRLSPSYKCSRCERHHRVARVQLMPFSLTCAHCKGLLRLTSIDGDAPITHRIVGDTLEELSCTAPFTNTR